MSLHIALLIDDSGNFWTPDSIDGFSKVEPEIQEQLEQIIGIEE